MIIQRLFSEKEKKNKSSHKSEVVVGGTGLAITGKNLKDDLGYDKGTRLGLERGRLKARQKEMKEAKELQAEVSNIKSGGFRFEKFRPHRISNVFIRNSGVGQVEAANNALNVYDAAKKDKNHKIAEKQLKSAEKHANKAVEFLTDEIASQKKLRNSAALKTGGRVATGLALTGGAVAGVHQLKKKKNKK
jgi:hypothetical protein